MDTPFLCRKIVNMEKKERTREQKVFREVLLLRKFIS